MLKFYMNPGEEYRQGVVAYILDNENRLLIIQLIYYKENEWNFVAGGSEDGESTEETLYREILEEVNIPRESLQIIGKSSSPLQYDFSSEVQAKRNEAGLKKYRGQRKEQFVLKFTGDKSIVHPAHEVRQLMWVKPSELATYLVFENQYDNALSVLNEFSIS